MIALLSFVPVAFALQIELRAEVTADPSRIRGTLRADAPVTLVNPLLALPPPPDDRTLFRTFPGRPDAGELTWTALEDGGWRFETRLPARYGDIGAIPGSGAWANGGWYPQPVGPDGAALVADWTVAVTLPAGALGVLNGRVARDSLTWSGTADRAALAVLPKGRVTELRVRGGTVRFVERDGPERVPARVLAAVVDEAWPLLGPPDLTVVEDLDLLRLARPAPGTVYLSDRAFRVTPALLRRYHVDAVRTAVIGAALQGGQPGFGDGWTRDFAASALAGALPAPSARALLGWFAWNPVIDALLYDGTLPYFSDLFGESFPTPTGAYEALGARIPGGAAAAQLDDLRGEGTAAALVGLVVRGAAWAEATAALAVPAALTNAWARPYRADQDYAVVVDRAGARVERRAPVDAPAEVVDVRVDGAALAPWIAGPGPDTLPLPGDPPAGRVQVDAPVHVQQSDRANDRWPATWTTVVNGGVYNINPSQLTFDLAGDLRFRRRNDSRNVYVAAVEHDAQDLLSVDLGFVRYVGPLVDRRTRAHRLSFFAGPSLLDPAFRPTDAGAVALGASAAYVWDTRTDDYFALAGHRLGLSVGGGFVPESDDRWASASVLAVRLLSPHPRHVFAVKAKAGWASGEVEHRLLPLGGGGDVRAIPEAAVVGNVRVGGSLEYRLAPLRNASVPLPLLWLSDVHLSPGIDASAVWRGEERYTAVGAAMGLHVVTELLGVQPNLAGVTVALPIWSDGVEPEGPQVYIDFAHAF